MAGPDRSSFLDRPAARVLALVILLLCLGSLAYLHRDELWPADQGAAAVAEDDPAAPCIEERFAGIDRMVTEGTIQTAQAELFKQRAEAMCRDTEGAGASAPPLPGLPPE
jgi:hypothetical protein